MSTDKFKMAIVGDGLRDSNRIGRTPDDMWDMLKQIEAAALKLEVARALKPRS